MAGEWRQDRDEQARVAWLKLKGKMPKLTQCPDSFQMLMQEVFIEGFKHGAMYGAEVASDIMAGKR